LQEDAEVDEGDNQGEEEKEFHHILKLLDGDTTLVAKALRLMIDNPPGTPMDTMRKVHPAVAGAIAHLWRDMLGNRDALSQSDTTVNEIIEKILVVVADNVWLRVDPKFIDLAANDISLPRWSRAGLTARTQARRPLKSTQPSTGCQIYHGRSQSTSNTSST
jgi:hypothetical protein